MALASLWIKVSTQLPRHPKTIKAADNLGISVEELIGRLCMLWIYCAEFRPSGYIATVEELAVAMNWKGEPAKLARGLAMIPCFQGFLDCNENMNTGFYVHDWDSFNNGASSYTEKRRGNKRREEDYSESRESNVMKNTMKEKGQMPPDVKEKIDQMLKFVRRP